MDIGITEIVGVIASSTTSYLVTFSPVFLLIGGLVLAVIIVFALAGFMPNNRSDSDDVFSNDRRGDWM